MNAGLAPVMKLSTLLHGEYPLPRDYDRELLGLQTDSRRVRPGDLFLACRGSTVDARKHIPAAIAEGAVAVLVEADQYWNEAFQENSVPLIPIVDLPRKLGRVAARFHGEPAARLRMIGITGTNGKTTCCQLIARALQALGYRCGVIGTLGHGLLDQAQVSDETGPSTTPDALRLQGLLRDMLAAGGDTVVMEVSSHGLDQHRVEVDDFDTAVFTNLSRDHLDYHGSMEAYGAAKLRLFRGGRLRQAVLNGDDPFTAQIQEVLPAGVRALRWSLHNNHDADLRLRGCHCTGDGLTLEVVTPWGEGTLRSPLLGSFNAANLLAVLATLLACEAERPGFDFGHCLGVVSSLQPVPGRMQWLSGYPVAVVVDYAHTPAGLEQALLAVREHFQGAIHCVFGCGGGRDRGKRAQMAACAEALADHVVVTDDNPRHEASTDIIADVLKGFSDPGRVVVQPARAAAIAETIATAAPGSVVLVAGKGHEQYQEIGGRRLHFSDVEAALAALQGRFGNGSSTAGAAQ